LKFIFVYKIFLKFPVYIKMGAFHFWVPNLVLFIVLSLIATRRVGKFELKIWQVMTAGAVIVILTQSISFEDAFYAIDFDVMLFLFSMFVIGAALEYGGLMDDFIKSISSKIRNPHIVLFFVIFVMSLSSALLMNDTIAVIGTPIVLRIAKKYNLPKKILLLSLAFSVTCGSVMSPIGNPQNFIIANHIEDKNPFFVFIWYLAFPTFINIFLTFLWIEFLLKKGGFATKEDFKSELVQIVNHSSDEYTQQRDKSLYFLSKISLFFLLFLIILSVFLSFFGVNLKLVHITLISALPILLFSKKRFFILRKVDWHTLLFFASMFVLMKSVWQTGLPEKIIKDLGGNLLTFEGIFALSLILSQVFSNVPLTMLFLPMIEGASEIQLMALAAGSTIAGNLFILGAASNVIIIQGAEKREGETITFFEFAKAGIPLTIMNSLIYYIFLN
jgi:Na+/H+ antiporter NhaD/arsenite permease-like protein